MIDSNQIYTQGKEGTDFKNEKNILENNLIKSQKHGHTIEVKKIKYSLEKLQNIIIKLEK